MDRACQPLVQCACQKGTVYKEMIIDTLDSHSPLTQRMIASCLGARHKRRGWGGGGGGGITNNLNNHLKWR